MYFKYKFTTDIDVMMLAEMEKFIRRFHPAWDQWYCWVREPVLETNEILLYIDVERIQPQYFGRLHKGETVEQCIDHIKKMYRKQATRLRKNIKQFEEA
jgi:hypothetical protein